MYIHLKILSTWTFTKPPPSLAWTIMDIWLTPSPPPPVHVVIECPQICMTLSLQIVIRSHQQYPYQIMSYGLTHDSVGGLSEITTPLGYAHKFYAVPLIGNVFKGKKFFALPI